MPRAKCVDHGNLSLSEINQRRTLAPIFGSQLARMPRAKCIDHGNLSLAEINQRRTLAPIFGSQLARMCNEQNAGSREQNEPPAIQK